MAAVEFVGVTKRYPDGTAAVSDLNLSIAENEYLCLLGPSGCGKSSTLRMLAGLAAISEGEIRLDGRRINEVPSRRRDMAMVFENYALYPHLTVFDNIAMPLRARRMAAAEIQQRVKAVAETLQLEPLLARRPHHLSGGQRQRVAVGRAIVRQPRMFLLDEPLGHLEAYLRVQLRAEVRRLHERLAATTVHITHDQEEAAAVSDRIAVMSKGRLQQLGTLPELLDCPVNRFVAEFIGMPPINLLPATVESDGTILHVADARLALSQEQAAALRGAAGALTLGIRPQDVSIAGDGGFAGQVMVIEPQGDRSVVIADSKAGRVSALVASKLAPRTGESVGFSFSGERIHLFAADGVNLLYAHHARRAGRRR
jgi:multiple sugar transport system ATP-binding protein